MAPHIFVPKFLTGSLELEPTAPTPIPHTKQGEKFCWGQGARIPTFLRGQRGAQGRAVLTDEGVE